MPLTFTEQDFDERPAASAAAPLTFTEADFEEPLAPSRGGYWTETARGLTQFAPALVKTTATVGDKLGNLVRHGAGLEPLPLELPEARPLYKAGQWMQDKLDAAYPAVPEPQRNLGHDVSTGLGQMASMVAGGLAARGAGATLKGAALVGTALGFGQEFDDAFSRARHRGDDPDTAFAKSLGYATVAALIENKLGAGRIIKKYFPDPAEAARKLSAWGVSKAVGTSLAVGFGEEGSQRFAQNWIVEGKPSLEGIVEEGAPGGIVQSLAELPATLLRAQGGRIRRPPIPVTDDRGLSGFAPVKEDPNVTDRESSSMEVPAGQPAKSVPPDAAGTSGEIQKPAAAIPQETAATETGIADELNQIRAIANPTAEQQARIAQIAAQDKGKVQRAEWQQQMRSELEARKAAASSHEMVRQAAVRMPDGKIYTGTTHGDAYSNARNATGYSEPDFQAIESGFVTTKNRFVDNQTAYEIAQEAKQITPVAKPEDEFVRPELEAQSFKPPSANAPIKETGAAAGPQTDVSGEQAAVVKPETKEPWQMRKAEGDRYLDEQMINAVKTDKGRIIAKNVEHGDLMPALEETGSTFKNPNARGWALVGRKPSESYIGIADVNEAKGDFHKAHIMKAIREGRPVPAEVLADYPDLATPTPAPASDVSPKQSEAKPITIDAALNLAAQRKSEGKSQLSVARELSEAGLSDGDATGIAGQVFEQAKAITPEMSVAQKEEILGNEVRQRILDAPSFPKLVAAYKSMKKAIHGRVSENIDAMIDKEPWDLLSAHAGVMNAKSARAKTLQSLAGAVIREAKLPMQKPGRYRGMEYRIDWDKVAEQPEILKAAQAQGFSIGEPIIVERSYGVDATVYKWPGNKVSIFARPDLDVSVYKSKSGWIVNADGRSIGKERKGVGSIGFDTPQEAVENYLKTLNPNPELAIQLETPADLFPDLKGKAPTLERVRNSIVESEADLETKFEAASDENIRLDNPIHAEVDLAQKRVDKLRALGQRLEREAVNQRPRAAETAKAARTTPAPGTPERTALEAEWKKWNDQLSEKSSAIGLIKEKKERTNRYSKAYESLEARQDKLDEQYYALQNASKEVREKVKRAYQEDRRESINPIESAKAASELGDREAYKKAEAEFVSEATRQGFSDSDSKQMFMDAWSYSIREEVPLAELVKKRGDMLRSDRNAAEFKKKVEALPNVTDSERRSAGYMAENDRYRPEKLSAEYDRLAKLSDERKANIAAEQKQKTDTATQKRLELAQEILDTPSDQWNTLIRRMGHKFSTKKLAQEAMEKHPERADMMLYRLGDKQPSWEIWYSEAAAKRRAAEIVSKATPTEPAQSDGSASLTESAEANIAERAIAGIEDLQKKLRGSGADVSMGVPKAILDLALEVARLSLKAGNTIYQAIDAAIAKIREQLGETQFDEAQVRASLNRELAPGLPGGEARAREEEVRGSVITQVQGVQIGIERDAEHIAATQQTIRASIFDGTQAVSDTATAQARALFDRMTDSNQKATAVGEILTTTNAQMGPGLVLAELWRYAEKMVLANGDDSFLRHIVPHYQEFGLVESGAGATALGSGMRALQETDTLFRQLYEIEKERRTAAGQRMAVGPELFDALLAALKGESDATVLERKTRTVLGTKVKPEKIEEIVRVVLRNTADPVTELINHFARLAGIDPVTPEQHALLVDLAQKVSDPNLSTPERDELVGRMFSVFNTMKLPPSLLTRLASNLVVTNLTGLPTAGINIFAPLVQNFFDLTFTGISSPMDFPAMLKAMLNGGKTWFSQMRFSLGRDAYSFLNNDYQRSQDVLKTIWERGLSQIKSPNAAERVRGATNMVFGAQQYFMRFLTSLDNANGMMKRQSQLALYTSAAMRHLKFTTKEIQDTVDMMYLMKEQFYAMGIESGLSHNVATVRADALAVRHFRDFLENKLGETGSEIYRSAELDAYSQLGRLGPEIQELQEGGLVSRTIGIPILQLSNWMRKQSGLSPALGVALLGYVNVPFRAGRFLAWNSPYGLLRLGIHQWRKSGSKHRDNWWKQSLATAEQERYRFKQALAGTAVMALVTALGLALKNTSADEDDEDGIYFTGEGPKNKQLRSAWMARQFKPYSMVIVMGKLRTAIPMNRSGEALAHISWILSARDQKAWRDKEAAANGKTIEPSISKEAAHGIGAYLGLLGHRGFLQTVFQVGQVTAGAEDPRRFAASKGAGFVAGLVTPYLGLQRSVVNLLAGAPDTSSISAAVTANAPVLALAGDTFRKPLLNRLGDPLYNPESSWYHKMYYTGIPIAFSVNDSTDNRKIYGLMVDKGAAPPTLRRGALEEKYGPLDNNQFRQFVQTSGRQIKQEILTNEPLLRGMTPEDTKKWLSQAATRADKVAELGMGLERVKVEVPERPSRALAAPRPPALSYSARTRQSPRAVGASLYRSSTPSARPVSFGRSRTRRRASLRSYPTRGRSRIRRLRLTRLSRPRVRRTRLYTSRTRRPRIVRV